MQKPRKPIKPVEPNAFLTRSHDICLTELFPGSDNLSYTKFISFLDDFAKERGIEKEDISIDIEVYEKDNDSRFHVEKELSISLQYDEKTIANPDYAKEMEFYNSSMLGWPHVLKMYELDLQKYEDHL